MQASEQRQSTRSVPSSAMGVSVVDLESGVEFTGDIRNLSSAGALFHADLSPVVGADMDLAIVRPDAPMLLAKFQVVRVQAQAQGFDIAGQFQR